VEVNRARRVVAALRERGINARTKKAGVYQFEPGKPATGDGAAAYSRA